MIESSFAVTTQTWHIYVLINPVNGDEFYVGMSIDPKERLRGHITRAKSKKLKQYASGHYIRALLERGIRPEVKIIESLKLTISSHDVIRANQREKEVIREYKKLGKAWTNDPRTCMES
jgi:hypothetical protein